MGVLSWGCGECAGPVGAAFQQLGLEAAFQQLAALVSRMATDLAAKRTVFTTVTRSSLPDQGRAAKLFNAIRAAAEAELKKQPAQLHAEAERMGGGAGRRPRRRGAARRDAALVPIRPEHRGLLKKGVDAELGAVPVSQSTMERHGTQL